MDSTVERSFLSSQSGFCVGKGGRGAFSCLDFSGNLEISVLGERFRSERGSRARDSQERCQPPGQAVSACVRRCGPGRREVSEGTLHPVFSGIPRTSSLACSPLSKISKLGGIYGSFSLFCFVLLCFLQRKIDNMDRDVNERLLTLRQSLSA